MTSRTVALAGVAAAVLMPRRLHGALPSTCLFRRITGRPCPTCGMTRSWTALGHGDVRGAFAQHPFGPPTFAAAVLVALAGPRALDRPALRSAPVVAIVAVTWLATWLVRLARRSAS